jgi:pantoate--beta-alanine ligase
MRVFDDLDAWHLARIEQRRANRTLGFVPTMGALHDGHLSLVERSQIENDLTLVSIFVNPTQFDDPADLAAYPRTLDADLARLRSMGADFVLSPHASAFYPDGFRYRVTEHVLSRELEGASRPGHFDGVLTVVLKLLNVAQAERAYFGEKDWQQLQLVTGMVEAFMIPTTIVACPTVREPDGLAMSSRNVRLRPSARATAPEFYRALSESASAAEAESRLRAAGFDVDYVEDRAGRRLGAVRLDGVRLIDNVLLGGRS